MAASCTSGFINAFKPPGLSSTAFGGWVRRRLGAGALGHWGTLDPAACGVLVLAVGDATKLLPYLPSDDKSYVFELRVGTATDTGDAAGKVVRTTEVPRGWADALGDVTASMVGDLEQTPPMFSAVKVGGRPLYKAARAGRDVRRAPRTVHIAALRVLGSNASSARIAVDCSAGTYVRVLCEQIGDRLGLAAYMSFLVRTKSGPFEIARSRTPTEIEREGAAAIIDPLELLELPRDELDDDDARRFAHGNPIDLNSDRYVSADRFVLALHRGVLIGVAKLDDDHLIPVRVLSGGGENG